MSFNGTTHMLRSTACKLEMIDALLDDLTNFFDELLEDCVLTEDREIEITCFMDRMKDI